jgi:hypothetical protein
VTATQALAQARGTGDDLQDDGGKKAKWAFLEVSTEFKFTKVLAARTRRCDSGATRLGRVGCGIVGEGEERACIA